MANCEIDAAISDQAGPAKTSKDLSTIPEGRVGQVCKEWLIKEDANLAYRLQNQEISQHYQDNRSKNRIVREDIPLAKHLQESELLQAQRVRTNYDRLRTNQTESDENVARQIQRQIWLEEEKAKRAAEEADERLAQKLLQKEKARQMKKRAQREKEQVARLSALIGADYGGPDSASQQSTSPTTPSPPLSSLSSFQRILTEDEQELDLSEFCMPPPPGLTPEELRYFLEEQDAEIARLLQHQELKRSKNPVKEKLAVIEAQDFELARMLQKMEKDRVRRIREKMRTRQMAQQQQQQQQMHDDESGQNGLNPNFELPEPHDSHHHGTSYQRTSTPISPQSTFEETAIRIEENEYDIPENHLLNDDADSTTYEEPYQLLCQQQQQTMNVRPQQPFHNIAMDLDPTYQRRLQSGHSASNLLESCVDDDDTSVVAAHGALAQSNDSLEKLYRLGNQRSANDGAHQMPVVTSTSSSRSSRTSSSSNQSAGQDKSHRNNTSANHNLMFGEKDDYAPPLPPRDVSLMSRYNNKLAHTANETASSTSMVPTGNFLPPHHPAHPNRRNTTSPSQNYSPNRASIYSTSSSNLPIQGHRRVSSMEKPQKKEKHKSQDGCKTQ